MKFYCFEIATENTYYLWASLDEESCDKQLDHMLREVGDDLDTYAVGTAEATSVEDAHNKIRSGDWEYTHKV